MFDPEKVNRSVANANFGEGWYDYDVVDAEDYEKLLVLYCEQSLLLKLIDIRITDAIENISVHLHD